jgi:hypothetical protein
MLVLNGSHMLNEDLQGSETEQERKKGGSRAVDVLCWIKS